MGSESEIMAEEIIGILIVVPLRSSNEELAQLKQSQRSCTPAASQIIRANQRNGAAEPLRQVLLGSFVLLRCW
jgi:hypothetical protein